MTPATKYFSAKKQEGPEPILLPKSFNVFSDLQAIMCMYATVGSRDLQPCKKFLRTATMWISVFHLIYYTSKN